MQKKKKVAFIWLQKDTWLQYENGNKKSVSMLSLSWECVLLQTQIFQFFVCANLQMTV